MGDFQPMKLPFSRVVPVAAALLTFIVYLLTLAPGVLYIDSGELAAVQGTAGIAHPTGYPLFTLLGFTWSKLFPFGAVIFRLNVLAAIFVSAGNYFFVRTVAELLRCWNVPKPAAVSKTKKKDAAPVAVQPAANPLHDYIAAAAGLGFLAFSFTYWSQSTGVEVYSLHILLLNAILFFTVKAWFSSANTTKDWLMVSIWVALGFCNHMTTVLVTPGIAILYLLKNKLGPPSLKRLAIMAGSFLLIVAGIYAYLPIRSGMHPAINWGNTHIGEYFWRHVTGKQYQVWMFSSSKAAGKNFDLFVREFTPEFSLTGLLFMVAGVFYGFLKNKGMTFCLLLNFAVTVAYSINYNIKDIQPYFMLAFISAGRLMALGVRWVFDLVKLFRRRPQLGWFALLIPAGMIGFNFSSVNQSQNYMYGDYTKDALNSVEQNAVIFSFQWDVFVSPSYYFQQVENVRKDVLIVDKELLRRSWYYDQLAGLHPEVMEPVKTEKEEFVKALMPFERGHKFNPQLIQQKFVALITAMIEKNYRTRPVYVAEEVFKNEIQRGGDVKLPAGTMLIPEKYFYRVVPMDTAAPYFPLKAGYDVPVRFFDKDKIYAGMIKSTVIGVMSSRLSYELAYGKKEEARKIWETIHGIDPKLVRPQGLE
jgi:hypothetical protein